MNRMAVFALSVLALGCSRSAAPQIPSSQPVVPFIVQTGATPPAWASIPISVPNDSYPMSLGRGPGNTVWFSGGGAVGYVTMQRAVTMWPVKNPGNIIQGPDGNMWFPAGGSYAGAPGTLHSITPSGAITDYRVGVASVCNGPDGNIWFVNGNTIGKSTTGGIATTYSLPGNITIGDGCRRGPDGRVWWYGHDSGSFAPELGATDTSGKSTSYAVPRSNIGIADMISVAGDLWFFNGPLYRVSTSGAVVASYNLGNPITVGLDGRIWNQDYGGVLNLNPVTGVVSPVIKNPVFKSGASGQFGIVMGGDGNLYTFVGTPSQIDVFIRRNILVSPNPITVASGAQTSVTISERNYYGSLSVSSANPSVAAVAATAAKGVYSVAGVSKGTTTVNVSDNSGNSEAVPVTVN